MTPTIVHVRSARSRRAFLNLPRRIYGRGDAWIEPLRLELAQRLDPEKNAFFRQSDAVLFLATHGRTVVGRISAQIDRLAHPGDAPGEGNFGFYEAIDDRSVGAALFGAAEAWLRERRAKKMVGPYNFRLEDPAPGFLREGFHLRPMFMMPYSKPYYLDHARQAGLTETMRLNSYSVTSEFPLPAWIVERVAQARRVPGLVVRPIDLAKLSEEAEIIRQIFNEALKNNWGFVPFTEKQVRAMARDLRRIADPRIILIAEVDRRPVGVVINLPNYNDILHDCRGRLFPKGLYRILFRKSDIQSMRGYAFAVLPEYQSQGIGVLLIAESWERCPAAGYRSGEITWVLGDNTGMNSLAEGFGGKAEKQYAIYNKTL
ncbi:MAG: GNAT family N-acetyltransferase [Deltaproteobacteria bacterium]|nr:GNAT family N-acetyltransferase [Deltaproteobacteria bacterium]